MMKIITFEDIKNMSISPMTCYQWVEKTIKDKSRGYLPKKISMPVSDGDYCNVMPCMLDKVCGTKIITRTIGRIPGMDSILVLNDIKSGDFLGIMDANWITAMRTAAVAVHSVKLFAKKDYTTIGMIGLGNIAMAFLEILLAVESEKTFNIRLYKYKDQAEIYAKRFENNPYIVFSYVDGYQDLVQGADVVVSSATYFEQDICKDEWFNKGVLLLPIHTRGFSNCDLLFDKIYADDEKHVNHFKNFNKFPFFEEVSSVVNQKAVGRENDEERILVYNIGIALHDIYFANKIYEMIQNNKNIKEVDFQKPTERLWL